MANYIDGFVLPVPRVYLGEYKKVAKKVAGIWKEYGALAYFEFIGDDMVLKGTKSFMEAVTAKEDGKSYLAGLCFLQKRCVMWPTKKFLQTQEWRNGSRHWPIQKN
ncbi:MAG: DUF1428 family protein [Cyclobacteriaceae bacterium]|nr:DUF1428 family protein [Cyclobacteriaceae bacterium]MCB0498452.1 DUF1428 family protein [Cyclobacteriaceae bacterium]MCW5901312.1 DUF1428 family protein [Cyclobacteriaceae bacterium]